MAYPIPLRFARPAKPLAAIGALGLLAACGSSVDADAPPQPADSDIAAVGLDADAAAPLEPTGVADARAEACNADLVEPYIGRKADFRVRSSVLESVEPIVNVRWLTPGEDAAENSEMTQLMIELDEDGTVLSANCQ